LTELPRLREEREKIRREKTVGKKKARRHSAAH